jgi:hypothetical protein
MNCTQSTAYSCSLSVAVKGLILVHAVRLLIKDVCDAHRVSEIILQSLSLRRYRMEAQVRRLMQLLRLRAYRRTDWLRSRLTPSEY